MEKQAARFSLAEITGCIALASAVILYFFQPLLALLPPGIFLLLCFGAPFFPGSGFFLPVISRGSVNQDGVVLTFDDGPSPESTPIVLALLAEFSLPATFFVTGEKAAAHPELIRAILDGGHTIGNHSLSHDYFLMLRSLRTLREDIRSTQKILHHLGIRSHLFRPPMGITSPRLAKVLAEENLRAVTYSCRAYDRGNRNVADLAGKIVRRLRPGHIILLHDLPPLQQSQVSVWQEELSRLFRILQSDFRVVPLEEAIGRPVMENIQKATVNNSP